MSDSASPLAEAIGELARLLEDARQCEPSPMDPAAVTLATVSAAGRPSVRTVFVTAIDRAGPVFFAHRDSGKSRQIAQNPHASMCCLWPSLRRQVTIEGTVRALPPADADRLWQRRPRDVQLAAWAGEMQGEEAADNLDAAHERARARFSGELVPRPPAWQGLLLEPDLLHFWRVAWSRRSLRSRARYSRAPDGSWQVDRVAPFASE